MGIHGPDVVYDCMKTYALCRPEELILAFDPGDTTGFIRLNNHGHYLTGEGYSDLLNWLKSYKPPFRTTLVVEQFVTRPGQFAREQIAGKVCGALELFAGIHHCLFFYQSPQVIKTMLPDVKALKEGGWSWSTPHELDALRHAIYYLHTR